MSKAKLRWPSALSALVAVTAELICGAVSVVRPLIWYHSSSYSSSFSFAPLGYSVLFHALSPLQSPAAVTGTQAPLPQDWTPTSGNWTKIIADELYLPLKPTTVALVRALKNRKHFTHLPSGTSTAGSVQLLFSVFALPSTQWYTIRFRG